ncbi:MAG: PilZ domain-containing protein [Bdellovibrionaceae bacterium]|nr:PilZ domain-containing protein [Pseudobdellovibrionaceae bacterium]
MKDVFKKVHLSDKKKIFKRIVDDRLVLLVKLESMDVQQVAPLKMIDDKIIECGFVRDHEFSIKKSEMAVISLNIGDDKYFFYGLLTYSDRYLYIDIQADLFYLQRRRSARLDLPDNYSAKCKIIDYKGKVLPFDCGIVDISSGGCRLSLSSLEPMIKAGTTMRLKITLGHQSTFEINGEVRHAKPIKDYLDLPQVMGIQFVDYDPSFEAKMLNLYMDVQREIFLRYVNKKTDSRG